jgi:hypothetical protein
MPENADAFSAKLSVRSNFATHHLRAAILNALDAYAVEQANNPAELGPWFDDMMIFVPAAVIMSAAALEANSHEIIQDRLDKLDAAQPAPPLLKGLEGLSKESGAMGKYKKLATLLGKSPPATSEIWEDAENLFRFRNSFAHFSPAWDHDTKAHDSDLARALKAKVQVSPAYPTFMFPYGFLTYSCAKWAVETARTFASDFSTLVGVPDRFAGGESLP